MSSFRSVVEHPRFTQDFDSFRSRYLGIDELHRQITWELAQNPRAGTPFRQAPDLRVLTTRATANLPGFWVAYQFDEHKIELLSIELVSEDIDSD